MDTVFGTNLTLDFIHLTSYYWRMAIENADRIFLAKLIAVKANEEIKALKEVMRDAGIPIPVVKCWKVDLKNCRTMQEYKDISRCMVLDMELCREAMDEYGLSLFSYITLLS
jgi:hypothetical protein